MKQIEVHQKYSAVRRIFKSLLSVSFKSGDETLFLMHDILLPSDKKGIIII